jgi:hypothetical protein
MMRARCPLALVLTMNCGGLLHFCVWPSRLVAKEGEMWPGRGLTGGNSQARKDVLRLGARRVRKCAQMVREAAAGERALEPVLGFLATHEACPQCAEAVLRLTEYRGFEIGATAGLNLAQWSREFLGCKQLEDRGSEYWVRAETLYAYYLRHTDADSAVAHWQAAMRSVSAISLRERADAYRKGAFVFAELGDWDEARQHVREAQRLHKMADLEGHEIPDVERYLGAVDVAEMYVEVSAVYHGSSADLQLAADAGRRLLDTTDPKDAPRTWLCGTSNFLAVAVCGWRLKLNVLSPEEVTCKIEDLLKTQVPPQNILSVYLRWLWCLAVGEQEGFSRRVRRRLDGVRSALVADGRYQEAMRVLLDAAWIGAYRGRYRPQRERWVEDSADLLRLGSRAGIDEAVLTSWDQACKAGSISSALAASVFRDFRGLPPGVECPSIALF